MCNTAGMVTETGVDHAVEKGRVDSDKPDLNVTASKTTCAMSNRRANKIAYLTEANDQMLTPLMSLYAPRAASPP